MKMQEQDTMVVDYNAVGNDLVYSAWNGVGGSPGVVDYTTSSSTSYPLYLGARTCSNYFAGFEFHEMIIYNRALSIFERRWMEAYLAYKWSITPW